MDLERRGFVLGCAAVAAGPSVGWFGSARARTGAGLVDSLARLQELMLSHPGSVGAAGARGLELGTAGIVRRLAELSGAERTAVLRGAGWLRGHADLGSVPVLAASLARAGLGGDHPQRGAVLKALTAAACAAEPRLTGAGDAVARLWLDGLLDSASGARS